MANELIATQGVGRTYPISFLKEFVAYAVALRSHFERIITIILYSEGGVPHGLVRDGQGGTEGESVCILLKE